MGILLFVGWAAVFLWPQQKPEQKTPEEVFHLASLNIHTRWSKGDDRGEWREGKLTCEGILGKPEGTHPHYLRCNPNFLSCWYRYHNEIVHHRGQRYSLKIRFPTDGRLPFTRREGALLGEIEGAGGEKYKISLLDTCSEVWLPQGYYGYGQYSSPEKDWRWDNIGRNIFVDKFLVSWRDIWEWGRYEGTLPVSTFPAPADGLTLEQMENYCVDKGKQLMESHVFDAATFHPGDINALTPEVNIRGNYPWTSKRMVLEESEDFPSGICLRLLSRECFAREGYQNFSSRSIGWTGISQVLGGLMEVQRNPLHPNKNMMLSSFYYPYYSPANQLARRGWWDGEGNRYADFNFRGYSPESGSSFKVGFRCMRKVGEFSPIVLESPWDGPIHATKLDYDPRKGGHILSEPKGIWHRIFKAGRTCLFYKTPYQTAGEVRLGEDCSGAYANPTLYRDVKNFKVNYQRFKTVLEFETDKKHTVEFIHYNLQRNEPFQLYDSPVNKSYRTGLLLGGWPHQRGKVGNPGDSTQVCHIVDADCRDVEEYSCYRCRYGFFEVLDFRCPQGGSKYCGRDQCGEAGKPACLRGFSVNKVSGSNCVDNWGAGFCQEGLRKVCDEKGRLMCVP